MSNLFKKCLIAGDIFITETILTGLQQHDDITQYWILEPNPQRRDELIRKYNLHVVDNPDEFINEAAFIILTCKAEDTKDLLAKIENKVPKSTLIVSVLGSIAHKFIQNFFPDNEVIRLVVNPSIISNEGLGAYFVGSKTNVQADETAKDLLAKFGSITRIETENELDDVRKFILANTFLSYVVVKSMIEAGIKAGFSMEQAGLITDKILKGASHTLVKFQLEGSEMLKEGMRKTDITNYAIELIKSYGIYDSIERYLTAKEAKTLFESSNDVTDSDVNYDWFEKFVSQ